MAASARPEPAMAAPESGDSLTAARVIEIARTRSPRSRLARSRVEEARGRHDAAGALHTENPTIEGVAGTDDRFDRRTEWELTVPFDPGWERWSRRSMTRAELAREEHTAEAEAQAAMREALQAYYRALHARDRLEIARKRLVLAERLETAAAERHHAGDVARLDVLLAQTERARAASDVRMAEHDGARASADLAVALGTDAAPAAGSLADRALVDGAAVATAERPDVKAAADEVRAADAGRSLAWASTLPRLAFRLDYGHESGEAVARPGLALTIPIFNLRHEERVAARERRERARIELEARQAAAEVERRGAEEAYAAARSAAEELGKEGLPRAAEVAAMAEEGYRAGKIALTVLLTVRQQVLDTEREYTDRLLDAALVAVDRALAQGGWR